MTTEPLTADRLLNLFADLSEKAAKIPTGARVHPTDYYKLQKMLREAGAEAVTVMGIPFGFDVFEDARIPVGKALLLRNSEPIGIIDID